MMRSLVEMALLVGTAWATAQQEAPRVELPFLINNLRSLVGRPVETCGRLYDGGYRHVGERGIMSPGRYETYYLLVSDPEGALGAAGQMICLRGVVRRRSYMPGQEFGPGDHGPTHSLQYLNHVLYDVTVVRPDPAP